MKVCGVILWGLVLIAPADRQPAVVSADTGERYIAVSVDRNGALAIRKADGRTVAVYKRRDQTTFDKPRLSPDRTAVAAQAMYPNCCTSYDIPLRLVVYEDGREHWFRSGEGLPIFWWRFEDGGRRVAYGSSTVHSGCGTNYELRDVRSETLIDSVLVPEDFVSCSWPPGAKAVRIPAWAKRLIDAR